MYTLLMLDDDLLFRRDNVVRRYGEAELRPDAVYTDPAMATPWPACWVFRLAACRSEIFGFGKSMSIPIDA